MYHSAMPWRHATEVLDGKEAELCDCWIWMGRTDDKGIPIRRIDDTMTTAARAEWEKTKGPVPKGKLLFAVCGNKLCVNPQHRDPIDAAEREYRLGRTLLNPDLAERAWQCAERGMPYRQMAKVFGISTRTAGRIAKRQYSTLKGK